jgi:DNA replication protein DnaC
MAQTFQEQLDNPKFNELTFDERFGMIIDREMNNRDNRRLKNLLKNSKFKYSGACIEDIDFKVMRGLQRDVIVNLTRNEWITKKQNVIITGPTGCGKTYIGCVLGNSLCRAGQSAYYIRVTELFEELTLSKADGTYGRQLAKLARFKLLILDDFGLAALNDRERQMLLEVIEDRYDICSTLIVSQLPLDKWHTNIGDPTIADAICDRLIHNSHKIKLKGESMRKLQSELTTS